jgi:hypothetical protein
MELSDEAVAELAASEREPIRALATEVQRLRAAIREHRGRTGHALCWINDVELWALVDPVKQYPHDSLPVREEFLNQCARFYQSRLTGTSYEEPLPRESLGNRNPNPKPQPED